MKKTSALMTMIATLSLTACASIVKGSSQDLNIGTNTLSSGECTLRDSKERVYKVGVPGRVTVNRGDGPLRVQCVVESGEGSKTVDEEIEPWTIGNVILGGIIGLGVDSYTGAYQRYPSDININIVNLGSPLTPAINDGGPVIAPATSAPLTR